MATSPTDIVNQAIDQLPGAMPIAEMRDGSREANAALRHYVPRIGDLLRSTHWNFARKQRPLVLVKDATNTDGSVPTSVPAPWTQEYLYPSDCEKFRFIPQLGTQDNLDPPLFTNMANLAPLSTVSGSAPAPFVIGTDNIVPNDDTTEGPGVTVILCNVTNAQAVYTARVLNPDLWDSLFMAATVGLLAAWLAVPCMEDKALALKIRAEQIAIVKQLIDEARAINGNESWTTADHLPDWLRIRGAGRWPFGFIGANAAGLSALSFDALSFPDGSVF